MTKSKKESKNKPKWKPKKFCIGVTLDINTGKVKKRDFVQAKTSEEEKKMEDAFAERWLKCYEILLGDKFDCFMEGIQHFINKYGEEKFIKEWNKSMKELEKKENQQDKIKQNIKYRKRAKKK
jgi:hypothetical protein